MEADAITARLAAGQNGGLTRGQLRSAGLTDEQVDRRLASGVLEQRHRGVFHHLAAPVSWHARLHEAVLACGADAVASHRSAARLHRLDGVPWSRPEITVPASDLPKHVG